jgi:hypothetical protein
MLALVSARQTSPLTFRSVSNTATNDTVCVDLHSGVEQHRSLHSGGNDEVDNAVTGADVHAGTNINIDVEANGIEDASLGIIAQNVISDDTLVTNMATISTVPLVNGGRTLLMCRISTMCHISLHSNRCIALRTARLHHK